MLIARPKSKSRFVSRYNPSVVLLDMSDSSNRELLVNSALEWTMAKDGNTDQVQSEIPAMGRLISDLPQVLDVLAMFHDEKLIGFSIEESWTRTLLLATSSESTINISRRHSF